MNKFFKTKCHLLIKVLYIKKSKKPGFNDHDTTKITQECVTLMTPGADYRF